MKVSGTIFLIFILFAADAAARQRSDIVVMKNGDRITCEIVSLEGGVLNVKLDYAEGTVSLQWSQVARLESTRLFIVKTEAGPVYSGTLTTLESGTDRPIKIEVARAPDDKVEIESANVVTIDTTAKSFWKRFNGDINVGMTYAKGNQSTQYNLNSSIEYPRDRWNAMATFNSNLSSTSGAETATRNAFNARFNRLLRWNRYFYTGSFSLLQSTQQGIGIQSNIGGGIGYFVKNSNRVKVSIAGGFGWQRTDYTGTGTARATQDIGAGIISTEIQYFKFKKTKFNLEAALLPAVSEPGRVYFRLNQSYNVKLFKDVSWNISFYGNWDNRPPIGLSGSDYGTSTGIGWTFGNK